MPLGASAGFRVDVHAVLKQRGPHGLVRDRVLSFLSRLDESL
jgi:hypothetical protein